VRNGTKFAKTLCFYNFFWLPAVISACIPSSSLLHCPEIKHCG
jgi:hypothetical protein